MSSETVEHWSRQAEHYARSRTHSSPSALAALVEKADPRPDDIVLDVGTGTGFTAMAFAPHVRMVYAIDLTRGMLKQARSLANERGLENLHLQLGNAESLPFPSGCFDIVTCRVAAHHFHHIENAVYEMQRVTKPGGKVAFVDSCAPEAEDLAALMNELEKRRDPTHFCNRSPSTIHRLFAQQGLKVVELRVANSGGSEFDEWVERAGTPPHEVEILRKMFLGASPRAAEAFRIRVTGEEIRFGWDSVQLVAMKPRT